MSSIRKAIERKFPRYTRRGECVYVALKGSLVTTCGHWNEAHHIVTERNELIDTLIEATELLDQMAQAHIPGVG